MELLQRWLLMAIVIIINGQLFEPTDWEFYVISIAIGIVSSPLFKKIKR